MPSIKLILVTLSLLLGGCMPPEPQEDADAKGAFSLPDELIPIPRPHASDELLRMSERIAGQARRATAIVTGLNPTSNLRLTLIGQVKRLQGVPRAQIKEVLTTLVQDSSQACANKSCQRIFGLEEDDIDDFLDETYRRLAAEKDLTKDGNRGLRRIFLGSFKRGPDETVPPPKSQAVRVMYKVAQFVGQSGVMIADPNYHFMIDLYPGDLKRAHRLVCSKSECEAEVLKPVRLNMNIPVFLNSHIIVRYRIGTEHKTGTMHHQAFIGGRITPVSVGDLLSVTIDFWAEVEQSAKTAYKPVIKNLDCSASVYCDLPWISIGADFDRRGIEFDHYIDASAKLGKVAEASPSLPSKTVRIEYKDLPEKIRQIKSAMDGKNRGEPPPIDPDILWTDFSGPRRRG